MEGLRTAFDSLDRDGDGVLSLSDVQTSLVEILGDDTFDFTEIFGKLDSHQQGFVTFEDFIETHTAITSLGADDSDEDYEFRDAEDCSDEYSEEDVTGPAVEMLCSLLPKTRNNILSLAEVQSVLNEKLAARGFGRELLDDLENFMDLLRREAQAHDSAGELTDQVSREIYCKTAKVWIEHLVDQAEDSVEDVTSDDASVSLATLESYSPDESQAETSTNNIVDKTVDNEQLHFFGSLGKHIVDSALVEQYRQEIQLLRGQVNK